MVLGMKTFSSIPRMPWPSSWRVCQKVHGTGAARYKCTVQAHGTGARYRRPPARPAAVLNTYYICTRMCHTHENKQRIACYSLINNDTDTN